jgi:hypothetical protein
VGTFGRENQGKGLLAPDEEQRSALPKRGQSVGQESRLEDRNGRQINLQPPFPASVQNQGQNRAGHDIDPEHDAHEPVQLGGMMEPGGIPLHEGV